MIETLSGTSAGSPTELITMNSPRRSIFTSTEIFIGGSNGTAPSPCHSPISGWKSFIVGLLFPGSRSNNTTRTEARTHRSQTAAVGGALDNDTDEFHPRTPSSWCGRRYHRTKKESHHENRLDHRREGHRPVRRRQWPQALLRNSRARAPNDPASRRPGIGRDVRASSTAARGAPPGRHRRPPGTWPHR